MQTALAEGDLAFRQHQFGHTPAPNWPVFLDFAGRYLHAPGRATRHQQMGRTSSKGAFGRCSGKEH